MDQGSTQQQAGQLVNPAQLGRNAPVHLQHLLHVLLELTARLVKWIVLTVRLVPTVHQEQPHLLLVRVLGSIPWLVLLYV